MSTRKTMYAEENMPERTVPLEIKPLLTLKEASIYTGIGINKLRDMSNERNCNYVLFVGRKRMFKRDTLLKFWLSLIPCDLYRIIMNIGY